MFQVSVENDEGLMFVNEKLVVHFVWVFLEFFLFEFIIGGKDVVVLADVIRIKTLRRWA